MTLQASPPISLADVAAELGVGLPLQLGASNVRALAGIPSGPIKLSDLCGKSNTDYTIEGAAWSDIAGTTGAFNNNEDVTLGTINVSVSIRMLFVDSGGSTTNPGYAKNGSGSSFTSFIDSTVSFDNGDRLQFTGLANSFGGPGDPGDVIAGTVYVYNQTAGGALIDSFTVNVS